MQIAASTADRTSVIASLATENAETFFDLVEAYGKYNVKIVVTA